MHSRRTSRCATTPTSADAMTNGSTPMSVNRVTHRRRIVGVQRREHEVAGLRGLHRDLRGLRVADLADQDDVGILPQDRAQRARERQLDLLVDLRLVDAGDLILDRILDRDDVGALRLAPTSAPSSASSSCRCRSGRRRESCRADGEGTGGPLRGLPPTCRSLRAAATPLR